ncbi:nucleotide pyrophosphohydrolase [Colwellia piezophila]|uniref:nucleotide pyrophosphohydrolase n=1 Tax=Colwellia piezophila TaxID=211668 RepID=UPI00035E468E|nr:nucleotide pyrophosphohydrolase [Colwellia piezophila]
MNTVINSKLPEDYMLHRITPEYQQEANVLLATTGVLNSVSGKYTLVIVNCTIEPVALSSMNTQKCHYQASVVNQDDVLVETFRCQGSPNQCFEFLVHCFKQLLAEKEDQIYLKQHAELTLEDILHSEEKESLAISNRKQDCLALIQQEVDTWINGIGVRYFSELTNLSNLIEEVGEVARLIGREYGEQSFKKGEKPECIKTAIADELSDVLFIVICLANQLGINLDEAFAKNMDKKTKRDTTRHKNNSKLN